MLSFVSFQFHKLLFRRMNTTVKIIQLYSSFWLSFGPCLLSVNLRTDTHLEDRIVPLHCRAMEMSWYSVIHFPSKCKSLVLHRLYRICGFVWKWRNFTKTDLKILGLLGFEAKDLCAHSILRSSPSVVWEVPLFCCEYKHILITLVPFLLSIDLHIQPP